MIRWAESNAWSVLTYQGANGGGGDTEDRVYDNSYEYRVNVGPVRFAVETQLRNGGNSGTGNAFEGDIGFDYMGLSMDFNGGKIYDAVSLRTSECRANGRHNGRPASAVPLAVLAGIVSDNTVFQVAAKYVIGPWKFYGGYEHVTFSNPNNPLAPAPSCWAVITSVLPSTTTSPPTGSCRRSGLGTKYAVRADLDRPLPTTTRTRTAS